MKGLEMKYFVLNPSKDDAYGKASRAAIKAYAKSMSKENPQLSADLMNWVIDIDSKRSGAFKN